MLTHRIEHARVRLADAGQQALLREALPLALQDALDAAAPGDAVWLLRRLPCRLALAADADLGSTVQALRTALRAAVQRALPQATLQPPAGDDDDDEITLLRLDDATAALVDAWADALIGRRDRGWAWVQLRLWPQADAPRARLLEGLRDALDRQPLLPGVAGDAPPPQRRRALLTALLRRGLLPRALALLTADDWRHLASGLPGAEALGLALAAAAEPAETQAALPANISPAPRTPAARALRWPDGADAAACLAALHTTPLPEARRAEAARLLAWLALLHDDAAGLAAAARAATVRQLQGLADAALATPRAALRSEAAPAAQPRPRADAPLRWRSPNAGLLHLLPFVPAMLAADEVAAATGTRPLRERLLALAVQGLGVPLADPVLAPWLGLLAPAPLQAPAPDAGTAADRRSLAADVQQRLLAHLPAAQRGDIGADPLPWLLQREAQLRCEGGRWLATYTEADTRLRRCGLDADPGWLPWLGLTVTLRYE